jgi:hypothetical protein
VTRRYQELVGRFRAIPFAMSAPFDPDGYVVSKALAGLCSMVGKEEKKFRTNPVALTTTLLQEVFKQADPPTIDRRGVVCSSFRPRVGPPPLPWVSGVVEVHCG